MAGKVPDNQSQISGVDDQGARTFHEPFSSLGEDFFNESGCSVAVRPEARRLCVDWLHVKPGHQVWDVGAGTGSVSLVSALRNPKAHYFALEKSPQHYRTLCRNIRRMGLRNVQPWLGEAPEILWNFPSPDQVYLGGTGGRVGRITKTLAKMLGPSDGLVASFVIDRNYTRCRNLLCDLGFRITERTIHFDSVDPEAVHFLKARRTEEQRF